MSTNLNALRETQSENVCRLQVLTQRGTGDLSTVQDLTGPTAVAANPTWATTAMNGVERWNVASAGNRPPRPPIVKGTRSTIQTVEPRAEHKLSYFVGRPLKDTTEADVVNLLEEVGVKDVKCTLIKAKDGRIFNTAAFKGEHTGFVQRYLQQRDTSPVTPRSETGFSIKGYPMTVSVGLSLLLFDNGVKSV